MVTATTPMSSTVLTTVAQLQMISVTVNFIGMYYVAYMRISSYNRTSLPKIMSYFILILSKYLLCSLEKWQCEECAGPQPQVALACDLCSKQLFVLHFMR